MKNKFIFPALIGFAIGGHAMAASPEYMMEDCGNNAQVFFQDFEARSETKYEGQRTDGTHAVNGTIYLETRSENFQCSYNAKGDTMVDFHTEGRSWPDFVHGKGSPHMGVGSGNAAKDDAFETVCGVMVSGQNYRYRCDVVDHYNGGTKSSTTLRFPDQTLKMVWKSGKHVELHFEGMVPITVRYATSEGETNFVFEDKTYFYYSDKGLARMEVEHFRD